jgi:hypothetical protein
MSGDSDRNIRLIPASTGLLVSSGERLIVESAINCDGLSSASIWWAIAQLATPQDELVRS